MEEGQQPRRIGRWRIIRPLGAGGMGTVHLGQSRNGDLAAVKVIHAGFASDPTFRARFRREVEISGRVRGPHLAELIEAEPDAKTPWLASRYVPGPTLHEHITEAGPLDENGSLAVSLALASALRDIHAAGVIHRDLKPGNVILARSAPVVIDFGIAAAADATSLTATGSVIGSAGWMSPEQIQGHPLGPETDIFSWGANVYFACTASPPFGNGRPEAVAYRVMHDDPDVSNLPQAVRDLVRSALAKEPGQRPSVTEVIQTLSQSVGDSPTTVDAVTRAWTASDRTQLMPSEPSPRRRSFHWSAVAAIMVLMAALTYGGLRAASQSPSAGAVATPASTASSTTTAAPLSTTTTAETTTTTATTTTSPPPTTSTTIDDRMATTLASDGRPVEMPLGFLRPGDCFDMEWISLEGVTETARRIPCGLEHDGEVAAFVELAFDRSSYPGLDAFNDYVGPRCEEAFAEYVGAPLGVEWVALTYTVPSEVEWQHSSREGVCLLVGTEGSALVGSKRDIRN